MWGTFVALFYQILAIVIITYLTSGLRNVTAWGWFWAYILAVNLVTFLYFGYDKILVKVLNALRFRVPEKVLVWGLAFPGGMIGAWIGMFVFRHKTGPGKQTFRNELLKALAIQAALVLIFIFLENRGVVTVTLLDSIVQAAVGFVQRVTSGFLAIVRNLFT